jgi:predicted transposase YdaD
MGMEKGREEGLEKGLQKGLQQAVRGLQKYGMDPKQISEALELPLGTVFRYLNAE